jgi:hypothetical protein
MTEHRERTRLPKGESAFGILYRSYIRAAKYRGVSWGLSVDDFRKLTSSRCGYCGALSSLKTTGHATYGTYIYNGIDRVDNKKGYAIDNVVACCETCNKAKRTMTLSEFIAWIDNVYAFKKQHYHGYPIGHVQAICNPNNPGL